MGIIMLTIYTSMLQRITAGFKRPLDRQPLSRFRGRNASVILLSFYCISLVLIKSVLIKPVLIKSFEMKRLFMVWIGFISICCSKLAKEGKSCPRLLVLQRVAQNAKSCSKVAEHNLFMPIWELTLGQGGKIQPNQVWYRLGVRSPSGISLPN